MRFENRASAGEELAEALVPELREALGRDPRGPEGRVTVLALPRGGVPVAAPVARALDAPLDVLLVRKLGVPGNPELAMGAVAEGGVRFLNDGVIRQLRVGRDHIEREVERETAELERRGRRYRGDAPAAPVAGRAVVVVDDGIATGATARAAIHALRDRAPELVVVAAPTGAPDSLRSIREEADRVVCLHAPEGFSAVAAWYRDFPQTPDEEVERLLARSREERGAGGGDPAG